MAAAQQIGHDVPATDQAAPSYGPTDPEAAPYLRADLTDHGQTMDLVAHVRPDAIVHAAGIPEPFQDTEVVVFHTSMLALHHITEAVRIFGVARLVWTSSETATGYIVPPGSARHT